MKNWAVTFAIIKFRSLLQLKCINKNLQTRIYKIEVPVLYKLSNNLFILNPSVTRTRKIMGNNVHIPLVKGN